MNKWLFLFTLLLFILFIFSFSSTQNCLENPSCAHTHRRIIFIRCTKCYRVTQRERTRCTWKRRTHENHNQAQKKNFITSSFRLETRSKKNRMKEETNARKRRRIFILFFFFTNRKKMRPRQRAMCVHVMFLFRFSET